LILVDEGRRVSREGYVTATEAAEVLGVKQSTLYAYVSRGRVTSYRQGAKRERLYRLSELQQLVELEPTGASRLPSAEDWIPFTG
jgi:citrate synthase